MSQVLVKAIHLIDLVANNVTTLSDIAGQSGMSRSTTHRLLATLVEHHYLALENKHYSLGYRLLELGEMKKRSLNFIEVCRPVLVRYAELTKDTIHLAMLDGQDIVLLDRQFGQRQLQINSYPGLRNKAFMTAVGKVLIGNLPQNAWENHLKIVPPGHSKDIDTLQQELLDAQKLNVAYDIDECNVGTCGIASSFMVNQQQRIACSINGATVYFDSERMQQLASVVKAMAQELADAIIQHSGGGEWYIPSI